MTRKAEFSAAHFYHNPDFRRRRTAAYFGKCANPHGHGHNYVLEVTVAGEPDPDTGMVLVLKELKDILEREVIERHGSSPSELRSAGIGRERSPLARTSPRSSGRLLEPKITQGKLGSRSAVRVAGSFCGLHGGSGAAPEPERVAGVEARDDRAVQNWNDRREAGMAGSLKISLSRRYRFAASHRLHSAKFSEEENRRLYGKCREPLRPWAQLRGGSDDQRVSGQDDRHDCESGGS